MKCVWCHQPGWAESSLCLRCGETLASWLLTVDASTVAQYWNVEAEAFRQRRVAARRSSDPRRRTCTPEVLAGLAVGLEQTGKSPDALAIAAVALEMDARRATSGSCCDALSVVTGRLLRARESLPDLREMASLRKGYNA